MFQVTIIEISSAVDGAGEGPQVERFRQTVDTLDVSRIVALINTPPRKRREARVAKVVKP